MNNTIRLGFSCGLGGLIGSVAALELMHLLPLGNWLAVVGFLVGGSFSWLSVNIREVVETFRENWRRLRGWEPDWEEVRNHTTAWAMLTGVLSIIMSTITWAIFSFTFILFGGGLNVLDYVMMSLGFALIGAIVAAFMSIIALEDYKKDKRGFWRLYILFRNLAMWFNPIILSILALKGVWTAFLKAPAAAVAASVTLWDAICFIRRVTHLTIIQVHSSLRALCFMGGSAGAVIGFTYGEPGLGFLGGAIFGITWYWGVSRGLLGLEPNGA